MHLRLKSKAWFGSVEPEYGRSIAKPVRAKIQMAVPLLFACLAGVSILAMAGCGGVGTNSTPNPPADNPVPSISSLSPASVTMGAAAQTLTINGTGFIPTSSITFNGNAYTVSYVSATQLTIPLGASDQATAGTYAVVVSNPSPGGGVSNSVNFIVNNPVPAITAISPNATFPCNPLALVTITGTQFMPGASVTFNGSPIAATVVNATTITLALDSSLIATPGTPAIVVTNPSPGGGPSNPAVFTISTPSGPGLSGKTELTANIYVYALNADGSNGQLLCTGASDGNGNFNMTLDAPINGGIRLDSSGGQVVYQNNPPLNYPQTSDDTAIFDTVSSSISSIDLDPISTLADAMTVGEMQMHQTSETGTHSMVNAQLSYFFLFHPGNSGYPPLELQPADPSNQNQRIAAVQGWLTEGLSLNPNSPDDIYSALDQDIRDGIFDGWDGASRISLDSGNEPVTAGTTDYLSGAAQWVQGPGAQVLPSGTGSATLAALTKGVTANVTLFTPFADGLVPSSTGAMTTLALQGHQYLLINDLNNQNATPNTDSIIVIDVTDPTHPGIPIEWQTPELNNWTVAGAISGGIAVLAGNSGHPQVFVYDESGRAALLNASILVNGVPGTDQPVDYSGALAISGSIPVFSDARVLSGAAWDGCWLGCQIELASADGYVDFTLASNSLDETHAFPVLDPTETAAESMGPDIAHYSGYPLLLAGNAGGMQLVDFTNHSSFFLNDSQFHTYFPHFPYAGFQGNDDVDANTADLSYEIGVLTPEQGQGTTNPYIGLYDIGNISETPASGGNLPTFSFSPGNTLEIPISSNNNLDFTGAAVDSDSHTLALSGSFSHSDIALGQIQNLNNLANGQNWIGLTDWVFLNAAASSGLSQFMNQGDPPGVIAFTSLGAINAKTKGISYGYMLDASGRGVLQVDINGLLAMPRQGAAGSGDPAHQVTGDPATTNDALTGAPILTEITWP